MLCQFKTVQGKEIQQIVAYASCTLDDVQSRYSQIEREALAVKWAVEHFHLYLYGLKFTVVTVHRPLVSIFSNPLVKLSARIERWCLNLQTYDFNIGIAREGLTLLIIRVDIQCQQ